MGSKPRIRGKRPPCLRLICPTPRSRQKLREDPAIAGSTRVYRTGHALRQRHARTTAGAGRGDHRVRRAACPGPCPPMQAVHGDHLTRGPRNLWTLHTRLSLQGQGLKG